MAQQKGLEGVQRPESQPNQYVPGSHIINNPTHLCALMWQAGAEPCGLLNTEGCKSIKMAPNLCFFTICFVDLVTCGVQEEIDDRHLLWLCNKQALSAVFVVCFWSVHSVARDWNSFSTSSTEVHNRFQNVEMIVRLSQTLDLD